MALAPRALVPPKAPRPVAPIRVMISSRCRDAFDGKSLSAHRVKLQQSIEAARIFGQQVFEVWINERAGPAPATATWWEWCLEQARDCDLMIVLFNGCSGHALMETGGVGICHAEFVAAMTEAPNKVRVIRLEPVPPPADGADRAFSDDLDGYKVFAVGARTALDLESAVQQSVLDALRNLALLGTRATRSGPAWVGPAMAWNRLDFAARRSAMRAVMAERLARRAYTQGDTTVLTQVDGQDVLAVCDAIPAALTVAPARELVGQPFLRDHLFAPRLQGGLGGPVHFIACHKGVTEAQAIRQLGYPDVTVVTPPFGVYVADEIQKIQMVFLKDCHDATSTRARVDEAREWLERAQEAPELRRRAFERASIVKAIAAVQRRLPPAGPALPLGRPGSAHVRGKRRA
jgi:hypothetical protein